MKNTLVLQMINDGDIESLKELLKKEILEDGLKDGNAKSRYAAMKRYFKYVKGSMKERPSCCYPCKDVDVYNKKYNTFIDGCSMVLTTESIGELESFDKSKGDYFNVEKLYNPHPVSTENIDLNKMLASAKAMGYKLTKAESESFQYVIKYKDSYYSFSLFDRAYGIVNDGKIASVEYQGKYNMLYINTDVGIAGILPVKISEEMMAQHTIVNIDEWKK